MDKIYLNPCTQFVMQIIKIKIKIFERKMGFSEIKRALKCFTVCCMPCPVRLSEGIYGQIHYHMWTNSPVDKSI
jgi:hypothetical protein